jgi:hypothetical protein
MRAAIRTSLVMVAIFAAVSACGSNSSGSSSSGSSPSAALSGEWLGKCNVVKDQDGSRAQDDADVKLRFSQDGKYSQSIAGPDGGQVDGTYTATDQAFVLKKDSESTQADYSIKDDVLTSKTHDKSGDTPVTSTCTLRRSSGG